MAAVAYAEGHYHATINSIGRGIRGGGAPVVAKAAYRSGECLFDERTQQWFDYRHKADRVIEKFIMLPEGAAAWGYERNRLWNASEAAEPRKNGRNATEFELALSHALTDEQRHDQLSAFVRQKVERYGIAADVAVHFGRDGNIHAHVVLSHRTFGPEGFGEPCNPRTVTKKRDGRFKKETLYGISANPDAVKELRREWADFQNAWFEKLGLDIRVDHRRFEERGIKRTPTVHLGPQAAAMEARGIRTDRGDINRMIEVGNAEVRRLEAEKQRQDAQIIDLQKVLAARLAQPPRTDGAERNYSKRQGDEITPEKDRPMQTPDSSPPPANQNNREIGMLEERERQGMPFTPTAKQPGRYDELKPPEPATARSDNLRMLDPDEARKTVEVWAAWQEPAFSLNTIRADPWTAVYLPVPEPETTEMHLFVKAHNAAKACIAMIEGGEGGPRVPQGNDGPAEHLAKAQARADEIHRIAGLEIARRNELVEQWGDPNANQNNPERIALVATQELKPEPPSIDERERQGMPFTPAEQRPGRYDDLNPEFFSRATLEADAWNAVYQRIPEKAEPELLVFARDRIVEALWGSGDGPEPEFRTPVQPPTHIGVLFSPGENYAHANERITQLDGLLELAEQREIPAEAPPPMPRDEAWQRPAFSLETIRADPATAVYLPIPDNADEFLLHEASHAAFRRYEDLGRALQGVTEDTIDMDAERGGEQRRQAGKRVQEIAARINTVLLTYDPADPFREELILDADHGQIARAWEQPAFSHATMTADPWTAVYLPIPHDAGAGLLNEARQWARDLDQHAAHGGALAGPFITLPHPNDPQADARARLGELDARLELAAEKPAPEIAAEARTAPEVTPAPTAPAAAITATDALPRAAEAGISPDPVASFEADALRSIDKGLRFTQRLLEGIARRIEAAIHFLSDIVAPEPKLTPQQVHDTLQANVGNLEKDHAQAVDAAQQEHDAAARFQQIELDTQAAQSDLSLAQRFGHNATREAQLGRGHEPDKDHGHELE
jgi:hypothetical protein